MGINDLAGLTLASQAPTLTTSRMEDLCGGALIRRLAREAKSLEEFRPPSGLEDALDQVSSSARVALDQYRAVESQIAKTTAVPDLIGTAGQLALNALAHAESVSLQSNHVPSLRTTSGVEEMMRLGEGLVTDHSSRSFALATNIEPWREAIPPSLARVIDQDLVALRQMAAAIHPLQEFCDSWSTAFGSSLTSDHLRSVLYARPHWDALEQQWQRDYVAFEELVRVHHVVDEFDQAPDTREADQDDAETVGRSDPVIAVALRYAEPALRISNLIRQLAIRIDPGLGRDAPPELLVLAIAHAHPSRARDLVHAFYSYLKRFAWTSAPRGPRVDGSCETLTSDDIEDFEADAQLLIDLLLLIESERG